MNDRSFTPNVEHCGSLVRLIWLATSSEALNTYITAFTRKVPDVEKRIELAERWIELVAARSQTLLQFNSIIIAVIALGGGVLNQKDLLLVLSVVWGVLSLPLLYNIFVFVGPPTRYTSPETIEFPFTLKNAAIRSLILNSVLIVSAVMTLLAAILAFL